MFNKCKLAALSVSLLCATAQAQITVGNVFWQDTVIPSPTTTQFRIDYRLFGSQFIRPTGAVEFYLTRDGGQTGYSIGDDFANISCNPGGGGCVAINTPSTHTVSRFNMDFNTITHLESLCQPTDYNVIALYNGSSSLSFNSATLGTVGQPDWLFASGILTPSTIPLNGSVSVEYSVVNGGCSVAGNLPVVGVFLTDTNLTPLVFFGDIGVLGGAGSNHSFNLSFTDVASGDYLVALVADRTDLNEETNENNNIGTFNLTISDVDNESGTQSFSLSAFETRSLKSFIDPTPDNVEFAVDSFTYDLPVTEGLKINTTKAAQDDGIKAIPIPPYSDK